MIQHRFKILGKNWEIRVLKRGKYKRKNGDDSVAITKIHKRRIDLGPYGCDYETIVHELIHAYLSELCVNSAELDVDALEEIFAELVAKRGKELLALADDLMAKLSHQTAQ